MLTKDLEEQFRFVTFWTSYTTGSPFTWNKKQNKLEIPLSKTFQYVRHIFALWSVGSFWYQTYWMYVGLRDKDQSFVETVVDLLYFSGGMLCVFLHVAYYFVDEYMVQFCNEFIHLSRRFEGKAGNAILYSGYDLTQTYFIKLNCKDITTLIFV